MYARSSQFETSYGHWHLKFLTLLTLGIWLKVEESESKKRHCNQITKKAIRLESMKENFWNIRWISLNLEMFIALGNLKSMFISFCFWGKKQETNKRLHSKNLCVLNNITPNAQTNKLTLHWLDCKSFFNRQYKYSNFFLKGKQ